jgi:hypothetical protein
MVVLPIVSSNASAADEAAAAAGASSAGASAGTATAAGLTTGTIAVGAVVAAAVAIAIATGGGESAAINAAPASPPGTPGAAADAAKALIDKNPAAAAAAADALSKMSPQAVMDLAAAFGVMPSAAQEVFANSAYALSAPEFKQLVAYAVSSLTSDTAKITPAVQTWINGLSADKKTAATNFFTEAGKMSTANLALLTKALSGTDAVAIAKIEAIQNMLKAAVGSDGKLSATTLAGIVALVKSIGSGDLTSIAKAQDAAMLAILTAKHGTGYTVTVTTTHTGGGIWTTVTHIAKK